MYINKLHHLGDVICFLNEAKTVTLLKFKIYSSFAIIAPQDRVNLVPNLLTEQISYSTYILC